MIDPVTAFVLFSAASSAMGALLLRSIRRANARRAEVWKKAAELLGGEFLLTRGPWQDRLPMAIRARVNGVHVCADSYVVSSGQSSNTWTRIVATNRDAPEVRIEVRERSLLTSVGRLLGAQDVDVSRPELSEHVIKAGDESIARAWISPSVARAIVACAPYTFSCGDKLSVVRAALEDDADRLARTARATAAFAARGDEIVAAWSSLASALSGVVEEPLVLVDRAVQGKIMCFVARSRSRSSSRWTTRARSRRYARGEPSTTTSSR